MRLTEREQEANMATLRRGEMGIEMRLPAAWGMETRKGGDLP